MRILILHLYILVVVMSYNRMYRFKSDDQKEIIIIIYFENIVLDIQ